MSGLPTSWITAPLGDFTIDCGQRIPDEFEEFKYIDIGSVNRDTKRIETPQQLLGKNAPSRARKHVKSGDVLVSMTRPNLNAVALVPDELDGQIASTGFDVLRASSGIEHRWVSYLVRTAAFVDAMSELVQGALYPAVRPRDIRGFEAPLAPLPEQTRIADKLDAVLARVDACRDRLDRIPAILKRFRQSVLAAATSGKLTDEWRADQDKKVTVWESTTFDAVCKEITVGHVGKMSSEYKESGIPFLRSLNVRPFKFDPKELRFISPVFHQEIRKSILKPGDVVVVRTGAPGQCCVIPDELPESNCSDLVIVRPSAKLVPAFACIFINSETSQAFVRSEQVGVAQLHFNVGSMKRAPLNLPSVSEQTEIVRRVESLFAFADRLEARHAAARAQVEKLTPATLARAFRGELVPQDPNDESASVLLQRIRAQRADQPKARRNAMSPASA